MTKNTQEKGWGYRLACLAAGLVVGVGATLGISAACGLFSSSDGGASEATADAAGGMVVGDTDNNGISLTATKIESNLNGAESAYSITATVTPSTATDTTIDLSLAFSGTTVSWGTASTGDVSDYVTLSADSITSGGSVTLYCYQAFGEQIILTGTASGAATGTTVSGTVTLDYAAKYTAVGFSDRSNVFALDNVYDDSFDDFVYTKGYTSSEICVVAKHGATYTVIDGIESGSVDITFGAFTGYEYNAVSGLTIGNHEEEENNSLYLNSYSISLSWDEIIGMTYVKEDLATADADTLKSVYENINDSNSLLGYSLIVLIEFTGDTTGNSYSLSCTLTIDTSSMYTYATAVDFSDSNLTF